MAAMKSELRSQSPRQDQHVQISGGSPDQGDNVRSTFGSKNADNLHRAFTTLLCLKLRAGYSIPELRAFVEGCTREAIANAEIPGAWNGVNPAQVGRVLRSWHLETKFLTPTGKPRPLRITGRSGLQNLICAHFPVSQFTKVFHAMKRNKLIKAQAPGCWLPTEQYAQHSKATAEFLSYFGSGICRLADTVTNNLNSSRKSRLLFERSAMVEALPKAYAAAFRRFVEEQATAFITTVDDWLERRCSLNGKKAPKSSYTAGVHAFSFLEVPNTKLHPSTGTGARKQ
jgi:hypothetical protein